MLRILFGCLALSTLFTAPAVATAQTEQLCQIMFENLSREEFTVTDVSLLQADGSKQEVSGQWSFKPSDRAFLGDGTTALEGRQVFYTITLPDGAKGTFRSTAQQPAVLEGKNCLVQNWDDDEFSEIRKNDTGRELSKQEATYRYWNAVHGIFLEENFEGLQDIGFLEFSKAASYARTMAYRIEDLDTANVDNDAVAAAKAYAAVLHEAVKIMDGRSGLRLATTMVELYNLKVDTLTDMLDENQAVAGKTEDLFQFLRSRRRALDKTYGINFPHLIPPVTVMLTPFTFSQGYYVNVLNTSGEDIKNVQVRFRDAAGNVKYQSVSNRMSFSPSAGLGDFTQIDPDDISWTVETGEWITVTYDGGGYSYPTSKLIKRD